MNIVSINKNDTNSHSGKDHQANISQPFPKKRFPSENEVSVDISKHYSQDDRPGCVGYYLVDTVDIISDDMPRKSRLTNFIIQVNHKILPYAKNQHGSKYSAKVLLENSVEKEIIIPEECFFKGTKLKQLLFREFGFRVNFIAKPECIIAALTYLNSEVIEITEVEYGYNEFKDRFFSYNLEIDDEGVNAETVYLADQTEIRARNLILNASNLKEVRDITKKFIENVIVPDLSGVNHILTAFTFLPFIYPFLEQDASNKPYVMLQGESGAMKSTRCKWFANFHGEIVNLKSFSSTANAIEQEGYWYKNALMIVDDLKLRNLSEHKDLNEMQRIIQNYSDGNNRSRMYDKYSKPIRGFLMINGEDILFNESSTLARGIILRANGKYYDFESVTLINRISKNFNLITPHFIKYVLSKNISDMDFIPKRFYRSRQYIMGIAEEFNVDRSSGNYSRVVNNFALLHTAFDIVIDFLAELFSSSERTFKTSNIRNLFLEKLKDVLKENNELILNHKPDKRFLNTLWHLLQSGDIKKQDALFPSKIEKKALIWYHRQKNNQVKIAIQLKAVYNKINNYLANEGGLGVSYNVLEKKLLSDNIIRINNSKRVSFSKRLKIYGYEFIGEYPQGLFD